MLVLTDTVAIVKSDSLEELIFNFADPSIGCVSSESHSLSNQNGMLSYAAYFRYEMSLRRLESQIGSLAGVSGPYFAVRKSIFDNFSEDIETDSDFKAALNSVKLGLRAVSEPRAIVYFVDVSDKKREFIRKVRTFLRGITGFFSHLELLNFFRYGLFSYEYFCHKLLRWFVPIFLCLFFVLNLILIIISPLFFWSFFCQAIFYGLGIYGWKSDASFLRPIARIPTYFLISNIAIAVAWLKYLRGERISKWAPSKR